MLLIILTVFFIATISQGAVLFLMSNRQGDQYRDFRRKWWLVHYIFNGILWLILLGLIIKMQFDLPGEAAGFYSEMMGAILAIGGLMLSAKSMAVLGLENAMGRRFFFPEESRELHESTYRLLNNPMYDGFFMMFVGLGLMSGIQENFQLALASLIFLNFGLASIENYRFSWNIF